MGDADLLLGRLDDLEAFTHSLGSPQHANVVLPSLSPAARDLSLISGFFREGQISSEQKGALKNEVLARSMGGGSA